MEYSERLKLATELASAIDSTLDNFSNSVSRVVALFNTPAEALERFIFPEIKSALGISIGGDFSGQEKAKEYTGERRDIRYLLGVKEGLPSIISAIKRLTDEGRARELKVGDYFRYDIKVPAVEIEGLDFPELDIKNTEIVIAQTLNDDGVVFQFEDILFLSAINATNSNRGGFAASTLAKYLNEHFIKAFEPVAGLLYERDDGLIITLPTACEIFGTDEGNKSNWTVEAFQLDFFKKRKNRIRTTIDDDAHWYWTSTPHASVATNFCDVSGNGYAGGSHAGNSAGGVSPAFCVRSTRKI